MNFTFKLKWPKRQGKPKYLGCWPHLMASGNKYRRGTLSVLHAKISHEKVKYPCNLFLTYL